MKWLIACFEPFDSARSNSSEIVWRHLRSLNWNGDVRFTGPLPVSFNRAWPALLKEIQAGENVLVLGQAEGRAKISLECLALNWNDARIADNDGGQPRLEKVMDGPDVLWSQIPWSRLAENEYWTRSYSAGTFVCNHVMYQTVNWAKSGGRLGGFVHVPLVQSQTDPQYQTLVKMPEDSALQAMTIVVKFLVGI